MLYFAIAAAFAVWIAADLAEGPSPLDARETVGGVLLCLVLAAFWPLVLSWRVLLGPAHSS